MGSIGNNAGRLSRSPKIKFDKGIQRTNNDSQIGFVSDLDNMEIIEGTLQRRKGTKLLNKNNANRRWYFLEEMEISGCNLLIGLDYKRDLYAFHPDWPEIEFKVLRKGLEKHYHSDTTRDFHVSFRRGTNFFVYGNQRHSFVSNDFGDTLRFDKRGYICFSKEVSQAHQRRLPADLEALRVSAPASTAGVWVDVVDATNRNLEDFYLFPDEKETVIPIIGPVRLAWKNEAGIISKFSPPLNLSRYKRVFASLYPGQSLIEDRVTDSGFEKMVYEDITTGDYTYRYLTRLKTSIVSVPKLYLRTAITDERAATFADYEMHIMYVAGDYTIGGVPSSGTITANQYFLLFPDRCASYTFQTSSFTHFLKIKNIRGWGGPQVDSTRKSFGDRDTIITQAMVTTTYTYRMLPAVLTSVVTGSIRSYSASATAFNTRLLKLQDLKLEDIEYTHAQTVELVGATTYTFTGALFECEIARNRCSFVTYAGSFKDNVFWSNIAAFIPLGFDCWKASTAIRSNFLSAGDVTNYIDFDVQTKELSVNGASVLSGKEIIIDNREDQVVKFWESGSRFVVWNNGSIISENQRLWADARNSYQNIYEEGQRTAIISQWSSELSFNSPNYNQVTGDYKDWRVIHHPFTRLEYQNVRSYPFDPGEIREIITNPVKLVLNNNILFVIQEGNLWIGDSSLILTDIIELGYTVYDMVEFYDGVLISGSKGLFYFSRTLDERFVKNTKIKAIVTGQAGAFYIDFSDHVWQVDLVFGESNVPFVRTTKISDQIKEITWGSAPMMLYTDETLWVKTDQEIWGYHEKAWTRKYSFDGRAIKSIHSYDNQLVIVFERATDPLNLLNKPSEVTKWYFTAASVVWS